MFGLFHRCRRKALLAARFIVFALSFYACGQVWVQQAKRIEAGGLPRPSRVLFFAFLADDARVTEYQGILRKRPTGANAADNRSAIRERASAAFTATMMQGLRGLGFSVSLVQRDTPVAIDDLIIDTRCLAVDQGDPLRRLIIGFGAGASKFEALVVLYQGPERRQLLQFATVADSGKLPGAAVTLPAGAAVQGGISAVLLASGAVSSGFAAHRTNVSQMAASSADEAVRYVSEFFASQGWISSRQVRKARIGHHREATVWRKFWPWAGYFEQQKSQNFLFQLPSESRAGDFECSQRREAS